MDIVVVLVALVALAYIFVWGCYRVNGRGNRYIN